ncbi:Sulfate permease 2 [Dimargaris xerosporica]|nr:Sulfate permease 2 [Dimargaris xerosporica]
MVETYVTEFKGRAQRFFQQLPRTSPRYLRQLVPISYWIRNYNRAWLYGDVIAGITVGVMVIPQALSNAKIAQVPIHYGLYTGFMGAFLYALLGTSRDITVGPTAVISMFTGEVAVRVAAETGYANYEAAIALAFVLGVIITGMGSFRLGIILDFISAPIIMGFTSSAALRILTGQIPGLFGIKGVDRNDETYIVIINTLKKAGSTRWQDMLIGLSACALFEALRLARQRWGKQYIALHYLGLARNAIGVIIFTLISFLVCRNQEKPVITITGEVDSGFPTPQLPVLSNTMLSSLGPSLVTGMLLCIIEATAIAKAFARKGQYSLNTSQELIALGMGNLCGSFFLSYPVTASFSRSAVNNQSGAKSPMNGIVTGTFVIVAILALPPVLHYVPSALLSAISITSVAHLISGPKLFLRLWRIDPLDFFASVIAFVVALFAEIDYGIYAAVGFSVVVMLFRIARPKWRLLAQVEGSHDTFVDRDHPDYATLDPPPGIVLIRLEESLTFPNMEYFKKRVLTSVYVQTSSAYPPPKAADRNWSDGIDTSLNEKIQLEWQRREARKRNTGLSQHAEIAVSVRTSQQTTGESQHDSFASDAKDCAKRRDSESSDSNASQCTRIGQRAAYYADSANPQDPYGRPYLRAVVFDFSAVNNIDSSGLQCLLDLRGHLREYAGRTADAQTDSGATDSHKPSINSFALHFVSVHPNVMRVLELSGITTDVVPVVPVIDTHSDESASRRSRDQASAINATNYDTVSRVETGPLDSPTARERWSLPAIHALPGGRQCPARNPFDGFTTSASPQRWSQSDIPTPRSPYTAVAITPNGSLPMLPSSPDAEVNAASSATSVDNRGVTNSLEPFPTNGDQLPVTANDPIVQERCRVVHLTVRDAINSITANWSRLQDCSV